MQNLVTHHASSCDCGLIGDCGLSWGSWMHNGPSGRTCTVKKLINGLPRGNGLYSILVASHIGLGLASIRSMRLPMRAFGCTLAMCLLRGLSNFAFIVQCLSPVQKRLVPQGGSPGKLERVVAADGAFGPGSSEEGSSQST